MTEKQSPLVSIIIPTFNEEKNIERLLKSIKNQTYKEIEVIVVDDGSTDNTAKISLQYTKKVYKRGHVERSAQRNFGANKSSGDYFLFIDGDMEFTPNVVKDAIKVLKTGNYELLVIPERTVGKGFIQKVRRFEREMYMGDLTIEVARLFSRKVFFEFEGYDLKLTGPEDYDLPYRISRKYKIGRGSEYILHHEENLTLLKLLKKKFYYASRGASYASKHPELIKLQGTILFRKVYLRNWKKFTEQPLIGISFLFVRTLETLFAVAGFISSVGYLEFLKTFLKIFSHGER